MNTATPLLSVIIPIYNGEKYLPDFLESILKQTNKQNIELIIVDDGSTDNTPVILNNYKNKFNLDFKLITKNKNEGLTAARLSGLEKAKGQYIYNSDADDLWATELIETLLNEIQNNMPDMIVFHYNSLMKDKSLVSHEFFFNTQFYRQDEIQKFIMPHATFHYANSIWTKCIKKDILFLANKYSDKEVTVGEDLIVSYACLLLSKSITMINKPLYTYRIFKIGKTRKDLYINFCKLIIIVFTMSKELITDSPFIKETIPHLSSFLLQLTDHKIQRIKYILRTDFVKKTLLYFKYRYLSLQDKKLLYCLKHKKSSIILKVIKTRFLFVEN